MTIIPQNLNSAAPIPAMFARSGAQHGGQATPRLVDHSHQDVITGDCLEVMRGMPDGSVDVIVTSPPYNIGMNYRSYDDNRPREAYLDWMDQVAAEILRLLTDDGSLFLNVGETGTDPWIGEDVANRFRRHVVLQNRISWIKSITIDEVTRGQFRPVNSARFLTRTHERIMHFSKSGRTGIDRLAVGVPYQDKSNLGRWNHAAADRRCAGNSWFIPYGTVRNAAGKHHHPAAFPLGLPRRCLKLHGKPGLVLDPFAGIGTTLVAARELGWRAIGIEIDEVYAETARRRIAEVKVGWTEGCNPCPNWL